MPQAWLRPFIARNVVEDSAHVKIKRAPKPPGGG
jgi:hypothetical protein